MEKRKWNYLNPLNYLKDALQAYAEFEKTLVQMEMVMGTQNKKAKKKVRPNTREVKYIATLDDMSHNHELDYVEKFYTRPDLKKWLAKHADEKYKVEVYEVKRKVPVKVEVERRVKVRID